MKKQIIGAFVGALILFIWQFLSWGLMQVHGPEYQYTENEAAILAALDEHLEEGDYFLPTFKPGMTDEEMQAKHENMTGKPWATIQYHKSFEMNMGMNLIRGIVIDFLAVFFLVWILMKFAHLDFKTVVMSSLAVGMVGYLSIVYLHHIWYETRTIGYLIDTLVQWGLVGAWLGFWLTRK